MNLSSIIRIYDEHHREISVIKGYPAGEQYRKFRIREADAYYAVIEDKAVLIFQCISILGIEIWISDYRITAPVEFYCVADYESLEFHNMVEGIAMYRLDGFGWHRIEAGQYNLIYLPVIRNKAHFNTHARTFDIQTDKDKLLFLSDKYPALKQIIAAIEQKQNGSLFPELSDNSLLSRYLIERLITLFENEGSTSPEAISLTEQLTDELCKTNTVKPKYKYNAADIRYIHNAATAIMEHLGDDGIFEYLNIKGLHPDKVREGFQILFGCSPKRFILDKKMEKAAQLIQDGLPLYDAAVKSGYFGIRQLRTAFLRHFGYSISEYKRRLQSERTM